MNAKRLQKIRLEIASLRRKGGVKSRELQSVAKSLGRSLHLRGKEPAWVSDVLPNAFPISIPNHPGDLNKYTARSILEQLENDAEALELELEDEHEES